MSDTVAPHSALANATAFNASGHLLTLRECAGSRLIHLEGACPGAELDAVLAVLGLAQPPNIGTSGGRDGARLLCLGPAIWLLVLDSQSFVPAALTLAGAMDSAFEVTVDTSHAYTRIQIGGTHAVEFIAKACALDLHPRKFVPGACAATGFAGMRTILWRAMDGDRFDLLVGRSYSVSLWEWMIDAAVEYNQDSATGITDK
jgi:sarcosine oxidase subunit gamma